jgi:MFS superfamily sulfate permease-like transporter
MALSLLRHVRHSYRPHTDVLVGSAGGIWQPVAASPGAMSGPGLLVYRFGAGLFYANANRFAAEVRALVEGAPSPVRWLILDAGAITSLDYSAARAVRDLQNDLQRAGVRLLLAHVEPYLRADLDRHRLTGILGAQNLFDRLHDALAAIRERDAAAASKTPGSLALS